MVAFTKKSVLSFGFLLGVTALLIAAFFTPALRAQEATVQLVEDPELGNILTDSDGNTLYRFLNDTEGESNCSGDCASAWPPLLLPSGDPVAGEGLTGELGIIERDGGGRQVTYNGMPLYFFANDENPGDTNGQGVNDVWYIVKAETAFVSEDSVNVLLGENEDLGALLTDGDGNTLYRFLNDSAEMDVCYDGCAVNWPPLLVGGDAPTAGEGVTGELGTITRRDGNRQVTYNGMPLYFFANDENAGDTNGQGVGEVWYIVKAETAFVSEDPVNVLLGENEDLGALLTDGDGNTLYRFLNDSAEMDVCYDGCANAWPPLLVGGDAPTAGEGVTGELGTITRRDGNRQVTYNGIPLYFFANDEDAGDTNGQGVGEVWYIVKAATEFASDEEVRLEARMNEELGTILTDADGNTLYRFLNDEGGMSVCYDGCAANWPPLLVGAEGTTAGLGVTGELGTTTRRDGNQQVTYNGEPLYFFANDENPGDTNGQGLGEVWFVIELEDVTINTLFLPYIAR
ncbi:MAG: hypothetical protein AAGF95_27580 [Chloroflexota bacterium]